MNNPDQVECLAVLQVLGQKHRTLTDLRRGHDEGVSPRQGVAFLQIQARFMMAKSILTGCHAASVLMISRTSDRSKFSRLRVRVA